MKPWISGGVSEIAEAISLALEATTLHCARGARDGRLLQLEVRTMSFQPKFLHRITCRVSSIRTVLPLRTVLLLNLALCVGSNGHGQRFPILPGYTAGDGYTTLLAVEDFNHDGKQDALVLNTNMVTNAYSVNLLLGNGHGGFDAPKTVLTNTNDVFITGDFNGDGIPDIAEITSKNTVQVFLNSGDGTFHAASPSGVLSNGTVLAGAAGDFNGDGRLDLVIQDPSNHRNLILLGKGDGTFNSPIASSVPAGSGGGPMVAADLTGSGTLDLAFSDGASHIEIMSGDGKGNFHAGASIKTNALAISSLIAADLEGNGKLNLAASTGFTVWPFLPLCDIGAGVAVLSQNASGDWSEEDYQTGVDSYGVAAADVNDDGRLDLVIENELSGTISVLVNKGSGPSDQFYPAVSYTPGPSFAGTNIIVKDVNGDGKPDILFIPTEPTLNVMLNQGDGKFIAESLIETGLSSNSMAVADLNHDGIPDIPMIGICGATPQWQFTSLLSGNGEALTTKHVNYTSSTGFAGGMGLGDLEGTGNVDAVLGRSGSSGNGTSLMAMLNNGEGYFSLANDPDTDIAFDRFILGNFNSDHMADVAAIRSSGGEYEMQVLLGKGDGQFGSPTTYNLGGDPVSIAQRDLNGDGISDLVVTDLYSPTIKVYLGTADGTFEAAKSYSAGDDAQQVAFGDFNQDGKMDLAVLTYSGVSILLGNGNGTFSGPQKFAVPENLVLGNLTVADLRGNGDEDVIVTAGVGGAPSIYVLSGNGKGELSTPVRYSGGDSVSAIFTGDFNGDGAIDIAEFDVNHTGPIILYNRGGTHISLSSSAKKVSAGQTVSFNATVSASIAESGTPTGAVSFQSGTTLLGTATLQDGKASFSTSKLTKGTDSMVATYLGNSTFNQHASSAVSVVVAP
jgi:hypothetical protein